MHVIIIIIIFFFFIGSQYWVFKDTMAMSGYPRPLSDWGLISHNGKDVKRVEAAFTWAHNGKTYIFSGGEFWRFNEGSGTENRHQDADYPRDSSLWKGVPINPDDIITWGEGNVENVYLPQVHFQLSIQRKLLLSFISFCSGQ